jgi:hypothetical protein
MGVEVTRLFLLLLATPSSLVSMSEPTWTSPSEYKELSVEAALELDPFSSSESDSSALPMELL